MANDFQNIVCKSKMCKIMGSKIKMYKIKTTLKEFY